MSKVKDCEYRFVKLLPSIIMRNVAKVKVGADYTRLAIILSPDVFSVQTPAGAKQLGYVPIWAMAADGRNPRLLTRGLDDRGANHPR